MLVTSNPPTTVEKDCDGKVRSTSSTVQCAGCGGDICDRYYLLAVDRQWHLACLTCCRCKVQLDSELTCFAKDGHIYCKNDYYRLFSSTSSKRCPRCHLSISPSEMVMRAREHVYHLHCFTCATCNKPLIKGEYFGLREDIIYCRLHYEMVMQYDSPRTPDFEPKLKCPKNDEFRGSEGVDCEFRRDQLSPSVHPPTPFTFQCDSNRNDAINQLQKHHHFGLTKHSGHKGRPKKQKSFFTASLLAPLRGSLICPDELCSLTSHSPPTPSQTSNGGAGGGAACSDSSTSSEQHNTILTRPKRMRTSFKHHQLRAMKAYFSINHNPDAKDLKQLSQKTGLSKRVLQVWFQNARAKWRRNLLRQRSQGPEIAQDSKPLQELTTQSRFCDSLRIGSLLDIQPAQITQEEQNIQTFTNLL